MGKYQFWLELFGENFWQQLCEYRPEFANFFQKTQQGTAYRKTTVDKLVKSRLSTVVIEKFLKKSESVFNGFYEPYILMGYEMLQDEMLRIEIYADSFIEDCLKRLLTELEEIGLRILIKEMHEKQESEETDAHLQHAADTDYYQVFCEKFLAKDDYREEVLDKYPALDNALKDCVQRNVAFYTELVRRIDRDKEQIQYKIFEGQSFRHLTGIDGAGGDAHSAGKKVLKLKLDADKTLIYKPHSIKNESVFYELAADVGLGCGTDMYTPRLLECDGYGWMECIQPESCQEPAELERYYYRMGVQLFLVYLLGTHDIHCENLIAKGEYPVIIDLENLVAGERKRVAGQAEQSAGHHTQWKDTVLSSGILPYAHWQMNGKVVDLSAISGGDQEIPFRIPVIKNPCTEKMHIGYRYARVGKTNNKALLMQKEVAAKDYETELKQGFEVAYWLVMIQREEMQKKLSHLRKTTCRYLVRDTQKYSMLLSSSYHPSVMEEPADREILLHSLWRGRDFTDAAERQIINAEINDLLENNIPFFYFQSDQTSLFDSKHREIEEYFVKPPFEKVYERLHRLNVQDLKYQTDLIHLSLHAGRLETFEEDMPGHRLCKMLENFSDYSLKEKLKMAERIADRLMEQSREDQNGLSWECMLVPDPAHGLMRLYPCGMYLYDGISGYAVFLHMLANSTKKSKYDAVWEKLDRQLFRYTDQGMEHLSGLQTEQSGLYNGEGSIVYAYLIFYKLHGRDIYLKYALKHAKLLVALAEKDEGNDLLDGKAGAIYVLCVLYQISGCEEILHAAEKIGNLLVKSAVYQKEGAGWKNRDEDRVLAGMAHGNAGILTALAKLYELTNQEQYYECMKQALIWEHAQFNETTGDWKDYRIEGKADAANGKHAKCTGSVSAWCHGAAGILLSRLLISKVDWKESECRMVEQDIQRAFSYLSKHQSRSEWCLCHGVCGNRRIMHIRNQKCAEKQECRGILTKEWYNPSLMNGYVGIGYYLLSEAPDFVDYLFLENF